MGEQAKDKRTLSDPYTALVQSLEKPSLQFTVCLTRELAKHSHPWTQGIAVSANLQNHSDPVHADIWTFDILLCICRNNFRTDNLF